MKIDSSWCNGFAWALAWFCFAVELAGPVQSLEAADRSDGGTEYDFELSKGLLLFGNHRYGEAEPHLQQAYNAKPGDPTAGYYHGLTLLRLQRHAAAEDQFRDVLRRHPEDARARMGLGMALYHREQYADALAALTAAEKTLKNDPLLFHYAGLAASAQQAYDQAADKFLQAGKLDPEFASNPHYQQAVALHSQGHSQEATSEFRSALEKDSAEAGTPALAAPLLSSLKRWSLNFAVSMQYDSNVVLLPGGTSPPGGPTGITHKDDFVAVFTGNGEYRFIQNDTWTVGAGYGFFQNIHARLTDFNVQDHTPTLYVQRRLGTAQLRLQYLLDYVTVGGDSYLLSNAFQPLVTVPESEQTFTQAFFRYQYKDFKTFRDGTPAVPVPVNQTRDGVNWMVGAMQVFRFSDDRTVVRAGYTFDTDRTGGPDLPQATPGRPTHADWAYIGHRLSAGITHRPLTATTLQLAFDYYRQNYSHPNSFSATGTTVRQDNVYLLTGTVVQDLRSWLWLAFQYSFTRDESNVPVFDYTRHLISLTLGGGF